MYFTDILINLLSYELNSECNYYYSFYLNCLLLIVLLFQAHQLVKGFDTPLAAKQKPVNYLETFFTCLYLISYVQLRHSY